MLISISVIKNSLAWNHKNSVLKSVWGLCPLSAWSLDYLSEKAAGGCMDIKEMPFVNPALAGPFWDVRMLKISEVNVYLCKEMHIYVMSESPLTVGDWECLQVIVFRESLKKAWSTE